MQFNRVTRWAMVVVFGLAGTASAQFRRPRAEGAATQPAEVDSKMPVTNHQITIDGKTLDYRATAGSLPMKDESGKTRANIFFVAYDVDGGANRPTTFLFNGGPGAASVWLHIGGVGPKCLQLSDASLPVGPPYKLIDNSATWLPFSDLVFVDPVGTGYSRAAAGEDPKQFYGFRPDIASCADFIRTYLTKNHKWGTPVYLAGESYGTTRCGALAGYLADRYGIAVSGVTLISSVLDFATLQPTPSSDLSYEMFLPSYTAVAWYHKKLSGELAGDLQKAVDASRKFTEEKYVPALEKGASLAAVDRAELVKQMSKLTGLSEDFIDRANLRINPGAFEKQVLGDGRQITGRYDGRITGFDPAGNRGGPSFDPSFSYYMPAYASAFNQYVRDELKFESDLPYEVLTDQVRPWTMNDEHGNPLYVTDDVEDALLQHPNLRVQFVSGYYDLATPFYAADYTINRMNLSPEARQRVSHVYFPSGHMIYHNREASKQMAEAMLKFMQPDVASPKGLGPLEK